MQINTDRYNSPNKSKRSHAIDSIILHHTAGSHPGCSVWLCDPEARASAHYVVTRQGDIYQLVPDYEKAWHAGRGAFDVNKDGTISAAERLWNDRSIGIELEAYSPYTYPDVQIRACDELVYSLCMKYSINANNILGHKEICVPAGRKIDPENFDMGLYRTKILVKLSSDERRDYA